MSSASTFQLVDVDGWDLDLHSIYTAYMGYFESRAIPWWDKSWGPLFATFDGFLTYGWPVVQLTDSWTNKPHVVTKTSSLNSFLKMIKTRYGETLPSIQNIVQITPYETHQRPLRHVTDAKTYSKLHQMLPAVAFSALKSRVKSGEPKAVQRIWEHRQHTFLAIDFEWSEKHKSACLEFGYAALRCGFLADTLGLWPPIAGENYRMGHYVVSEYVDQMHKRSTPVIPWDYAWGESQLVSKSKLGDIIQGIISSFASPEVENAANDLVLVVHGISGDLERLQELRVKLPKNVLILDTAVFERQMFAMGLRGVMMGPKQIPRQSGNTLSLSSLVQSFGVALPCKPHNAGNDAFLCLLGLQLLLQPEGSVVIPKPVRSRS